MKVIPGSNHIFYALNADAGTAVWASADEKPDNWTSQFFSVGFERSTLIEYFPSNTRRFLKTEAPLISVAPPVAALLDNSTTDGIRTLRMHISSPRLASAISIYVDPATDIREAFHKWEANRKL